MREAVVVKSYRNGLTILLDREVDFPVLLGALSDKFSQARDFFGKAQVALSLEGRPLTREEEIEILETIRLNSDIRIACIVGRDEETDRIFMRALRQAGRRGLEDACGQFYKGTLRNHEVLEAESSIVVLGDVCSGCKVVSRSNIVILGGLYGEAYAGAGSASGERHCVAACKMAPEKIRIGDFRYRSAARRKRAEYIQPKIAYVRDKRIIFEVLPSDFAATKDLSESL